MVEVNKYVVEGNRELVKMIMRDDIYITRRLAKLENVETAVINNYYGQKVKDIIENKVRKNGKGLYKTIQDCIEEGIKEDFSSVQSKCLHDLLENSLGKVDYAALVRTVKKENEPLLVYVEMEDGDVTSVSYSDDVMHGWDNNYGFQYMLTKENVEDSNYKLASKEQMRKAVELLQRYKVNKFPQES
ncbi:hypothetical protein ACTFR8_22410 [Bacillus cereus group sp. MYBK15-3]|uniref:hypothetical protein n=1 Tax=unclassified Bacillus cereus group TaxID=2750818 RepID=UPI003F78D48E